MRSVIRMGLIVAMAVALGVTSRTAGAQEATPEAQPAAPAEASSVAALQPQPIEPLLNIQVNPADLGGLTPDQWERLEFTLVTVKTGESFTTDHSYFTCCPGIVIFHVLEGSASFLVDGPTDLYAADSGQSAVRIPAGSLYPLDEDQTAVFAAESPAIVTNTGTADLAMLGGYGFEYLENPGASSQPPGYYGQPVVIDSTMGPLASNTLDVTFERVVLEPGALTVIESNSEEPLAGWFPETNATVRMAMGEHHVIPTDRQASVLLHSFVMTDLTPGPYTFFNTGKNPATLYFMRFVPVVSAAANPAP